MRDVSRVVPAESGWTTVNQQHWLVEVALVNSASVASRPEEREDKAVRATSLGCGAGAKGGEGQGRDG